MDLPLEHGLEVLLHLAPGHAHHDAHVHGRALGLVGKVGADHGDLAVVDGVEIGHVQVFKAVGLLAAELDAHVRLAHHLALEGRAVGHGHGHFGELELHAAHLDAFLHQLLGPLQVVRALDLIEGHGDHVLVASDAGRQDLGDDGVGDDGEAEVDGAGSGGVLQVVDLAQRQHEGEHPVLVVEQDVARLAALEAAEGERRAGGKAERIDGADGVGAEGHGVGVVAQLHALFHELVDDAAAVDVAGQEAQDVAPLQLPHDLHGHFVGLGAADDGGKAGHAAIDELDAPRAQLDVVDGAVQVAVAVFLNLGAGEGGAARQREAGQPLGLLAAGEAHGLEALFGEESGHARVERLAQIGHPAPVGRDGMEQRLRGAQHRLQVAQLLHRLPGHAEHEGQVVGGIRKGDGGFGAFFGQGGIQRALELSDDLLRAANGVRGNVTAHLAPPYSASAISASGSFSMASMRASPERPKRLGS